MRGGLPMILFVIGFGFQVAGWYLAKQEEPMEDEDPIEQD